MSSPDHSSSPDNPHPPTPAVAVITCAVLELEVQYLASKLSNVRHVEILPQGLHNTPSELRIQLQQAIERVERNPDIEAIVLGYGLCSRGAEGVFARRCTLVIPRAHDCITVLLGDKDRYAQYVARHPGTYWYSPGWNKHHVPPGKMRYDLLRQQYVEKYGEDNADFLMEAEQSWFKEYTRATYVDLGVSDTAQDIAFTQSCAQWLGWHFDRQQGDISLLRDLLSGNWDDQRFLVLRPGETLRMTPDERVVEAIPASTVPENSASGVPSETPARTVPDPRPFGSEPLEKDPAHGQ